MMGLGEGIKFACSCPINTRVLIGRAWGWYDYDDTMSQSSYIFGLNHILQYYIPSYLKYMFEKQEFKMAVFASILRIGESISSKVFPAGCSLLKGKIMFAKNSLYLCAFI